MGLFPHSHSNLYILVVINYVSKRVKAITNPINDANMVLKFLKKNIFKRFGTLKALLGEKSIYSCKIHLIEFLLKKYRVFHNVATSLSSLDKWQVELLNHALKCVLEKRFVGYEVIGH